MKTIIIILLSLLIFNEECTAQRIISKEFPDNPTSYMFKIKIDDARFALERGIFKYSDLKFEIKDIYDNGTWKRTYWPEEVKDALSKEVNKYDVWMSIAVDSSDIYFKNKKRSFGYEMVCIAHFTPIDSNTIKIEIKVLDSKVNIGTKLLPSLPHFVRGPVYKSVKPTTIEEYKIIQCLGRELGVVKQMPILKIAP